MPAPRAHPWALGAFALYVSGGLLLGERFPFSRFTMYADIAPRDRGAVPFFLANGKAAEPHDFRGFHGLSAGGFSAPEGVVGTLGYIVAERAAWVVAHPAGSAGPVDITVGYDLVRVEDGRVLHDLRITAEGTAWP
ncbi:MAG: hypothetical protein Q8P41_17250 [Pseudomonadota bacterium]|nr:hypothetical protein [Pseudomonadota bacterium]